MQGFGSESLLLFISQSAGIILLLSTMLLVGYRRIYFDAETKKPIEIELPVLGRISTQTPAILLIFVAAFLVVYPLTRSRPDMATVIGDVDTGDQPVTVRIVAVPQFEATFQKSGRYHLPVPLIQNNLYRVEYIVNKQIVSDQEVNLERNEFHPAFFALQGPSIVNTLTRKEVSDDALRKAGIPVSP